MADQRYVTLMASLPYHGVLFGARQTPLSRFQLEERLAWLEPDDAATLASIETLLRWGRNLLADTDEKFLERANGVMADLDNELLADYVTTRLETRTLIAALRKRAMGHGAPSGGGKWGYGRWQRVMQNHWNEPDLGLGHVYPWIADAERLIRQGDSLNLERLFMEMSWKYLARYGSGHYFDFEAVAVYALKWDLIDRWTRYDEDEARERIIGLAESGLGNHQQIYH